MVMNMKKIGKLILYDTDEIRRIEQAAKAARIPATEWIRVACRQRLEREAEARRQRVAMKREREA